MSDSDTPKSAAAKLFDIRLMIGALFVLYGLMLTVAGFFTSDKERAKAAGININLWLGLGMLVLGVLFLVWRAVNPVKVEPNPTDEATAPKTVEAAMPTDGGVIVVGLDGSDGSRQALVWAAGQARLTSSSLRAVATWRWPNYVTRVPPGADPAADTAAGLHEAVEPISAEFPDLEITEHVVQGPAGPSLLTQAEGATLLVVGARGRAAFPGMLLGSVAEYCVRNGPCPVVVVRAADQ